MSFFGVTIETINTVKRHPQADRLDIATLAGSTFQFVVGRESYVPGDKVVYFPIDSILPERVQEQLGLTGKLSGKKKDRVKTVRLRGEISQGIVGPASLAAACKGDLTEFFGVTKYEPPEVPCKNGRLHALPEGLSMYDIEGADRYAEVAQELMNQRVLITEKLEGSNFSVTYNPETDEAFVSQRRFTIVPDGEEDHSYWAVAKRTGLLHKAKRISQSYGETVTLYGEFIGPGFQKNIYRLSELDVRVFDIKVGYNWIDVDSFVNLCTSMGIAMVPILGQNVLLADWLCGRTIQEASNGTSALLDTRREGIVIRPMREQRSEKLGGRLILKQRSPEYLEREK
jgi:RNA ligase (TIGR02306 family)